MSDIYLNPQERYTYKELFKLADVERKSFLEKREGMTFFSNAGIPNELLKEIWNSVDTEGKGYITETEFYVALKLIACAQNGIESNSNILSTQVPLPQFRGFTITPNSSTEIEPITATERDKYIEIFQSCNLVDGLLYGEEAQNIFIKSKLPNEKLNSIWMLADTRKSGTLNKTEFVIAMHYISRLLSNPTLNLPQTLPSQTYIEATGRFPSSIRRNNTIASPVIRNNTSFGYVSPVMSHVTGSTTSLHSSNQVILSPNEIEKYKTYFHQLDTDNSGFIDADEAVYFFSHSRLPDSELGLIWEIADSKHIGKLDLYDFSVAMHLINMRKNNQSIDQYMTQQYQSNNQRYELENQLVEIKQQIVSQQNMNETISSQLKETKKAILDLESQLNTARNELNATKNATENAENELEIVKRKRDKLLGYNIESTNTPTKMFVSSLPELTRASSTISGSTILSPLTEKDSVPSLFDTSNGFKKSLSPVQAKAISKYGFDITMFDTLSLTDKQVSTSVNDDLAEIFNSPVKSKEVNNFDSVFM